MTIGIVEDRGISYSDCPYMRILQVTTWTLTKYSNIISQGLVIESYDDFVDFTATDVPMWFQDYKIIESMVNHLIAETKKEGLKE